MVFWYSSLNGIRQISRKKVLVVILVIQLSMSFHFILNQLQFLTWNKYKGVIQLDFNCSMGGKQTQLWRYYKQTTNKSNINFILLMIQIIQLDYLLCSFVLGLQITSLSWSINRWTQIAVWTPQSWQFSCSQRVSIQSCPFWAQGKVKIVLLEACFSPSILVNKNVRDYNNKKKKIN